MPDKWEPLRSLPFTVVIEALGFDPQTFNVRKSGSEWYGACPIHKSKQNHTCFSYNANGKFQCFSCNAKGRGAIDLVRAVRNTSFTEAVEFLEGLKTPQTPKSPPTVNSDAVEGELKPLEKDTWRKFAIACPWLEQRVPDAGIRERYGVFCYSNPSRTSAYSGRVMIPVKDMQGSLFGYLGRAVPTQSSDQSDTPKYLFPKGLEKSKFLFGAHELAAQFPLPVKFVYLLESPFAVMKFASLGLSAVSPYGWSISPQQLELLANIGKGVVYLPDRNKRDTCQNCCHELSSRLWLRFPPLPEGIDDPEQLDLSAIQTLTK